MTNSYLGTIKYSRCYHQYTIHAKWEDSERCIWLSDHTYSDVGRKIVFRVSRGSISPFEWNALLNAYDLPFEELFRETGGGNHEYETR